MHGCQAYNIGTGRGYSVFEMINAFEKASDRPIPYVVQDRRSGDIAQCYANTDLSHDRLGWSAQYELETMMLDHWRWQSQNPNGY